MPSDRLCAHVDQCTRALERLAVPRMPRAAPGQHDCFCGRKPQRHLACRTRDAAGVPFGFLAPVERSLAGPTTGTAYPRGRLLTRRRWPIGPAAADLAAAIPPGSYLTISHTTYDLLPDEVRQHGERQEPRDGSRLLRPYLAGDRKPVDGWPRHTHDCLRHRHRPVRQVEVLSAQLGLVSAVVINCNVNVMGGGSPAGASAVERVVGYTAATVAAASTRPAPQPPLQVPGIGRAWDCRAARTWAGVRLGLRLSMSATRPATCGAAMLVPM